MGSGFREGGGISEGKGAQFCGQLRAWDKLRDSPKEETLRFPPLSTQKGL